MIPLYRESKCVVQGHTTISGYARIQTQVFKSNSDSNPVISPLYLEPVEEIWAWGGTQSESFPWDPPSAEATPRAAETQPQSGTLGRRMAEGIYFTLSTASIHH